MTNTIQTTNNLGNNNTGTINLATNDQLFVLPGVIVSNAFPSTIGGAVAINGGTLFDQGSLVGVLYGIGGSSVATSTSTVVIQQGGSVSGGAAAIGSTDPNATWKVTVAAGGSATGGGDGINVQGPLAGYVAGSVNGGAGAGIAVSGSAAASDTLTVDSGGKVQGVTTGVSSTNGSASWTITALANGSIVGGTDAISLTGAARIVVNGTVNGNTGDGIKSSSATAQTYDLTVGSGGAISGGSNGVDDSNFNNTWNVEIASGGSVSGSQDAIAAGTLNLVNYGTVSANNGSALDISSGVIENFGSLTSKNSNGIYSGGSATYINYGNIYGQQNAIVDNSFVSTDKFTLYNFGNITSPVFCISDNASSSNQEVIYNVGHMQGLIQLDSYNGSLFDSTMGTVQGQIQFNGGSGTVVAGQTGGKVLGAGGNDIFYANPTAKAVSNRAQTTLDGAGGNNALYGDGAFTTFIAGDAAGGTNQVWGGLSALSDVAGYANNTISFAASTHGVYVDLLNGHNAYLSSTANWTGTGVFEDWIAAAGTNLSSVPNVIGSNGVDAIACDKGVDRITGGGGADALYAGTGAASQDTFVYTRYGDSNLAQAYDTIVGFKIGTDKIDISAFMSANGLGPTSLAIFTNGTTNSVYVEKTPGTLNSATDLAMVVNTSAAGGLHASDFIL